MGEKPGRTPALDGFRGLAILAVMAYHFQTDVFPSGSLGVDLFFVLSGFLITGLLLKEQATRGNVDLRLFYVRRALRLWPALTALVAYAAVQGALKGHPLSISDAAQALTYTTNLVIAFSNHQDPLALTWSLGVEEQFYLLWPPLVVLALARGRILRLSLCAFAVLLVVEVAEAALITGVRTYFLPTSRFYELVAGGLLAVLLEREAARHAVSRLCILPVALLGLVGIGVAVLLPEDRPLAVGTLIGWVVTLSALAVIGHVSTQSGSWFSRGLGSRPSAWIGQRSYSIYLWHLVVLGVVADHLHLRPAESLPLLVGLSLIVGHLSFELIEKPFLRLKPYPASGAVPRIVEAAL